MPTKFSIDVQDRICQLIRTGATVEIAAEAVGIGRQTFFNWQTRRAGFRRAVEQARAEAEAILVGRVHKAASAGSWRAAAWLLERQWPERWAPLPDRPSDNGGLDDELERLLAGD